jgi:hypothetical protein
MQVNRHVALAGLAEVAEPRTAGRRSVMSANAMSVDDDQNDQCLSEPTCRLSSIGTTQCHSFTSADRYNPLYGKQLTLRKVLAVHDQRAVCRRVDTLRQGRRVP